MPVWKQRDGTEIEISHMSDGHLLNVLSLLRGSRRAGEIILSWTFKAERYAADAPDGAAMAIDSWIEAILTEGGEQDHLLSGEWDSFKEILEETKKRSLDVYAS